MHSTRIELSGPESGRFPVAEHTAIAYLVSQYPAVNHTFILREIRQLRASGFDIHVISIRSADRPPEEMTSEELDELALTHFIKPHGLLGAIGPHLRTLMSHPLGYLKGLAYALELGGLDPKKSLYNLAYFAEAVIAGRWMERKGLSHFHVHFSSMVGLIATRVFPITMSITIHGPDEFNDPVGFRLAAKVKASSFICAISNYARSQLMKATEYSEWSKLEVSPLGIDPYVFAPAPFRDFASPFEIICVGRLAPAKGYHILIEALYRLVKEGRDVRLRIIGDGPDRRRLEQNASERGLTDNVVFEGYLNQDRVRALYRSADIFALASFAEGVPVVLMEAMAMEIPCVATCITGIPELIRDGVEGLLVPPSDDQALAAALVRLIEDPMLRRRLGKAGRRRVVEKYNLGVNVTRLAEIFQERLGASP